MLLKELVYIVKRALGERMENIFYISDYDCLGQLFQHREETGTVCTEPGFYHPEDNPGDTQSRELCPPPFVPCGRRDEHCVSAHEGAHPVLLRCVEGFPMAKGA